MKRLGKKTNYQKETIEAYVTSCSCKCFCDLTELQAEEFNIQRVYIGTGAWI